MLTMAVVVALLVNAVSVVRLATMATVVKSPPLRPAVAVMWRRVGCVARMGDGRAVVNANGGVVVGGVAGNTGVGGGRHNGRQWW